MYDMYKVGTARSYASTQVNSYLKQNGGVKGLSSNSLSTYLNTAQGAQNSTVFNTMSFARENTANLTLLKSASAGLASAAKTLGKGTLQSSDSKVLTAEASYFSGFSPKYNVDVQNIATQQKSSSSVLGSNTKSVFDTGQNSLMLNTEKGSVQIDFSVKEGESNLDSLNSIAKSINDSQADVTARVVTSEGKSQLEVASKEAGAKSSFEISAARGKTAAEKLEMRQSQKASDANYSINGKGYSSATNTVSIPDGRGATMTLNGTGSAQLTRATDASGVVAAAQNFASAYNLTVSHLVNGGASGAGATRALGLVTDNRMTAGSMASYGGATGARLSAMGISVDQDGNMQVDEKKLTAAVQENSGIVKDALAGYNSLADTTQARADEAMRIPTATYTNFSNMQVQSSLINMLMPGTGSLFDFGL